MGAAITGWGASVPDRTVDNEEIAERLGLSDDWIVARSGIRTRHISDGQTTSSLGAAAAVRALERAGRHPCRVDAVVCATLTPDSPMPAAASLIQASIGAEGAAAFDVNAACSGFLYALAQATAMVETGMFRCMLVVGADVLSGVTDPQDRGTSILFGDGAGAVLIEHVDGATRIGPFALHSDGSRPDLLCIPRSRGTIRMEGREVYRMAVVKMVAAVEEVLGHAHLGIDDVDLLVTHQANARILEAVAKRLRIDEARVASNIERYGNTSAASIPLALSEAADSGRLHEDDVVVLTAFGAGFAWGGTVVRWGVGVPDRERRPVETKDLVAVGA